MSVLLTPEAAADRLGVSVRMLRDLRNAGHLPCVRFGLGASRKVTRYIPEDIDTFIQHGPSAFAMERGEIVPAEDDPNDEPEPTDNTEPTADAAIAALPDANIPHRDESRSGFVYFVSDGELIKIGRAVCVRARLHKLRAGSPRPLRLIHYVPGGLATERRMHRKFRALREHGEWFRGEAQLLAFIKEGRGG